MLYINFCCLKCEESFEDTALDEVLWEDDNHFLCPECDKRIDINNAEAEIYSSCDNEEFVEGLGQLSVEQIKKYAAIIKLLAESNL